MAEPSPSWRWVGPDPTSSLTHSVETQDSDLQGQQHWPHCFSCCSGGSPLVSESYTLANVPQLGTIWPSVTIWVALAFCCFCLVFVSEIKCMPASPALRCSFLSFSYLSHMVTQHEDHILGRQNVFISVPDIARKKDKNLGGCLH